MRGRKPRIDRAAVADCAARGMTISETAALLKCSRSTIWFICDIEGVKFRAARGPGRKRKRYPQIVSAIRDGAKTSAAIAAKLGVTRNLASVSLYHLARENAVVKSGWVPGRSGHAAIEWRLPEAAQ